MVARVVVVGSYARDFGVRVATLPRPGETVLGADCVESDGGKGSNQAVQAARFGAQVTMVAAVGDDHGGRLALELWRREGIDTSRVDVVAGASTGLAMIAVAAGGENQIVVAQGANRLLSARSATSAVTACSAAALVVAQLEVPVDTVAAAFRAAKAVGAHTLLNAAPARETLSAALLRDTDILVVNEREARTLSGESHGDGESIALHLRQRVGRGVVVTLGAAGALVVGDGAPVRCEVPTVEVIDTTGAGDAFVGAFACAWVATGDLVASTRIGVAAGSHACRGWGTVSSYATAGELAAWRDRDVKEEEIR